MAEKTTDPSGKDLLSMSDAELNIFMRRQRKLRDVNYHFTHNNKGKGQAKPRKQAKLLQTPEANQTGVDVADISGDSDDMGISVDVDSSDGAGISNSIESGEQNATCFYELEMSEELSYVQLLNFHRAVVYSKYAIFMCRMKSNGRLDISSYVTLVKLGSTIYCTCSPAFEVAMTSYAAAISLAPPGTCSHLDVLPMFDGYDTIEEWVNPEDRQIDEHDYSATCSEQVISVSDHAVVVYHDRGFATVVASRCDCVSHNGACMYRKIAHEELTKPDLAVVTMSRQSSISWRPIPFILYRGETSTISSLPADICKCGSCDIERTGSENQAVTLYDLTSIAQCQVFKGLCKSCGATVYPDGKAEHVLNMGNFLVSHGLLRQYCKNFVTTGMALFSFYKMVCWDWRMAGYTQHLSYNQLRLAWLAFMDLVDCGSSSYTSTFRCPTCLDAPSTIICDGITLSFQRRYLTTQQADPQGTKLSGSVYEKRVLIPDPYLRKKLRKLIIIDNELLELARSQEPWLVPILRPFEGMLHSEIPKPWFSLIRDISSNSSAIGLVDNRMDVHEILTDLNSVENAAQLSHIKDCFPALYMILRENMSALKTVQPFILHLISKLRYVTSFDTHVLENASVVTDEPIQCLPALPLLVTRGRYMKDKEKVEVCRKTAPKHKMLTPGIFTISCPHGICYGFQVMDKHESPNVPFTILRTRFPQGPSLVIYDNACNLQDYCLNRDPGFFAGTKFCVDRFHWYNHKDCSSGYNIRSFAKFSSINTQVAEQVNAKLASLRSVVSYCNEENFKRHIMLFLWFSNTIRSLDLKQPSNDVEYCIDKLKDLYSKKP